MTIEAIAPVLSRIVSIQTRIGAPPAPRPTVSFADELRTASAVLPGSGAPDRPMPHPGSTPHVGDSPLTVATGSAVDPRPHADVPTGRAHRVGVTEHVDHHVHADQSAFVVVSDRAFGLPAAPVGGAIGAVPAGTPYAPEYARAADSHGVPGDLLAAVGWVESRYQPDVVSSAGAIGVMQLMPFVADELGVDPWNPVEAIDGAARLLRSHFDRFGSWSLALGAYFSGAGAVSRAGNELPSPRAVEYVRRVHERMEQT